MTQQHIKTRIQRDINEFAYDLQQKIGVFTICQSLKSGRVSKTCKIKENISLLVYPALNKM